MKLWDTVVLVVGTAFLGAAEAAEDIGWYTAAEQGQSARSYWISGPQGVVILGTQLLASEAEAMLRERNLAPGARR
jgi:hypothetical protein